MKHPLMWGSAGSSFLGTAIFGPLGMWSMIVETHVRSLVSANGAVFNLNIRLTAAPGLGKSWTFTVYINGVAQALTCTISGANTTGSDLVHSVPVLAGDRLTTVATVSGAPAATRISGSMAFQGTLPNQAIIPVAPYLGTPVAGTWYGNFQGMALGTPEYRYYSLVSCSGKFKNLYVSTETALGVGKSLQIILRVNGADTALTATVSGAGTTASDLANEVAVNPGDRVDFSITAAGGPPSTYLGLGFMFQSSVDGEYPMFGGSGGPLRNYAPEYNLIQGGSTEGRYQETEVQQPVPLDLTLSDWYGLLDGVPGLGAYYLFTMRPRTGNGNLMMLFAGGTVSNNDIIHSDVMVGGDLIAFIHTQSLTPHEPATRRFYWGVKSYILSVPPGTPPTVTTQAASGLTPGLATLNGGLVDDGGEICTLFFEWGATPSLGNLAAAGTGNTGDLFSALISGLLASTTYYFRAGATNPFGTSYGVTLSLTSIAPPPGSFPTVLTLPAVEVRENGGKLRGLVQDSLVGYGDVRFQWGGTADYGNTTPWLEGYKTADTFEETLLNLAEGAVYHFRAQFRGSSGIVSGSDSSFSTLSGVGGMGEVTFVDAETLSRLEG